jgi:integrase
MDTDDEKATVSEIAKLTDKLSFKYRKIDERKLNDTFDEIPDVHLRSIVRRRLPKPSKVQQPLVRRNIPANLKQLINDISLFDEQNNKKRLILFISYCRYKNYSYNTVTRYVNILKSNGVFGTKELNVKLNKLSFGDSGKRHIRAVSINEFVQLCRYLHNNFSRYSAPILVAVYTGLRTFEILQWSTLTLHQLRERQSYVSVSRKQTVLLMRDGNNTEYWKPIYNTQLQHFINELLILYQEEYNLFVTKAINNRLFHVTSKTLVNRIRHLFYKATGVLPPFGFGIHSCRNMIATITAQTTNNISAIKTFLQHKNVITTKRYINADFTFMRKEFDRLTRTELSSLSKTLRESNDGVTNDNDDDAEAEQKRKTVIENNDEK